MSGGGASTHEASSEAIQAWGGIYLLGAMLGDDEMRDTGAMGWAIESSAMREYWMDVRGENLPEAYDKDVVGILFAWGPAYATYFSGDPGWIYGIQWLPISPLLEHLQREHPHRPPLQEASARLRLAAGAHRQAWRLVRRLLRRLVMVRRRRS